MTDKETAKAALHAELKGVVSAWASDHEALSGRDLSECLSSAVHEILHDWPFAYCQLGQLMEEELRNVDFDQLWRGG